MLITLSEILTTATTYFFTNFLRETQLKVDQTKAYYMAQAGIMRTMHDWLRMQPTPYLGPAVTETITGTNLKYTTAISNANRAYFSFDKSYPSSNSDLSHREEWTTYSFNALTYRRLQSWHFTNMAAPGPNSSITARSARVTVWKLEGGVWVKETNPSLRLVGLRFNNWNVIAFRVGAGIPMAPGGSYANGQDITFTSPRSLPAQTSFGGGTTYFEWNDYPNFPDPVRVTVQWTFSDDRSTLDSKTPEIVFWQGPQDGRGRPSARVFCITATGEVTQTRFKVLKTIRAMVPFYSTGTTARLKSTLKATMLSWEKLDKGSA